MKGKVVLITGGSDGLGKAIAKRLVSAHQVVILSPTEEKVKTTASELGCDFVVADVSKYSDIETAVKQIVDKYGRIDCLINNAGIWIEDELDQDDPARIEMVMKVNCLGVMFASKAVIPVMKKQKSGLIVNISSQAGLTAKNERTVYGASKWAVTGFTKALQIELAKYGIGVTGVFPGKMVTEMFSKTGNSKDFSDGLNPDETARVVEFLLTLAPTTVIPEVGVKYITN